MPTLNWIGKEAVVRHHREVPFRLLEPVPELSCGPADSGNLIVQGDNLHALKALLPRYAGQVKCIYIDPPYNTGNEGWVYNDNVSSPEIRRWLGDVVGKEGETLDRHDRWLCMMYPRLVLLKEFLQEDGAIFVSIDDNEVATLRLLMDEIFGSNNFVATIAWHKRVSPANDAKYFSTDLDSIIVFAKRIESWRPNRLVMTDKQVGNYRNPDNDLRGPWNSSAYTCAKTADERPNLYYEIRQPHTGKPIWPSRTRVWAYERTTHDRHVAENMIYWGADGLSEKPRLKKFLTEAKRVVPRSFWTADETGNNQEGKLELNNLNVDVHFATPKPTRLIQRILQIATNQNSMILDSFAGSGTSAHAVIKQNGEDGGDRRFILVEMEQEIARSVTAERVKRVAQGYTNAKGSAVEGLGGGFQFCRLSAEPLFDATGQIRADVTFAQLAEFVWFAETGSGYAGTADGPLIGVNEGIAIYLLYNGILKDTAPAGGNVLTGPVFDALPKFTGPKVIYAAANRLGSRTAREGITFKQTPYALDV
ncbi:site-specific DNA-methyltransferase [uncultured Thiodictyon sp.]|uniref:site-specific DNA-methyltransferase n=1 Tax=uncultured Thiodictyon sp. TaxID=1846217 RepID=UPI0025EB9769|nr:site-specific DNA-methyltransferase [uncultured Thiodictyon sp.]